VNLPLRTILIKKKKSIMMEKGEEHTNQHFSKNKK
jgi:hypothetical protein